MLEFRMQARRLGPQESLASTKDAEISLDTAVEGRRDAFNPVELLMASLAACMIKSVERLAPMLQIEFQGVEVTVHGVRQDSPPTIISIDYELVIDTPEGDHGLELLHANVRKFGAIFNTIGAAVPLKGEIKRKGTA